MQFFVRRAKANLDSIVAPVMVWEILDLKQDECIATFYSYADAHDYAEWRNNTLKEGKTNA